MEHIGWLNIHQTEDMRMMMNLHYWKLLLRPFQPHYYRGYLFQCFYYTKLNLKEDNMKKYEYLSRPLQITEHLNTLGQEGWELVCINQNIFIFKREIVEEKTKKK